MAWALIVVVAVTILVNIRVLTAGQYQVGDLQPVGASRDMVKICLLPYQDAGLGRPNPIPVPGLCVLGFMAAVVGQTGAQHLFLIGCLLGAGFSMLWLLRRLGKPATLCLVGALLYEFSPAIVNQFNSGGPGILLAGAVFPAVIAGMVGPRTARPVVAAAPAAALLSIVTLFNPQAPILIIPIMVPFLAAALARNGWSWTWRFCAGFLGISAICSLPLLLSISSQSAVVVTRRASSLAQELRVIRPPLRQFAAPYAYVGLVPAALGAMWALVGRGSRSGERAAVGAAVTVVAFWAFLRVMLPALVSLWPVMALFKDFIKLQILLGIPVVVLTVVAVQATARLVNGGLWAGGFIAGGGMLAIAVSALFALEGTVLVSGDLGLGVHAVPRVVGRALADIRRRAPDVSSYRILWLPQDLRAFGMLTTLAPSSLMFRPDATPAARRTVMDSYRAFSEGRPADIAPLLGEEGVRYVVLNTAYMAEPDAPFQRGAPVIAEIGGTQVLAGAPEHFAALLNQAIGLVKVGNGKGYSVYENQFWQPILTKYKAVLLPNSSAVSSSNHPGNVMPLPWAKDSETKWGVTADGSLRIEASRQKSWSPVSANVPVLPGQAYEMKGVIASNNAEETHLKVFWLGSAPHLDSFVAVLPGAGLTRSFDVVLAAPPDAQYARVAFMGGWSSSPSSSGFSVLSGFSMREVRVDPTFSNIGLQPIPQSLLKRQLPDLLLGSWPEGSIVSALPGATLITLGDAHCPASELCAWLLKRDDLEFQGDWGMATGIPSAAPLDWFTTNNEEASITVPSRLLRSLPAGSSVTWLDFPGGDLAGLRFSVHRRVASPDGGPMTLQCNRPRCALANLIVLPPLPSSDSITRVLLAYSPTLVGKPGDVRPVEAVGDWATLYSSALAELPSPTWDPSTWVRVGALGTAFLAIIATLLMSSMWRSRGRSL